MPYERLLMSPSLSQLSEGEMRLSTGGQKLAVS
jgi:hypothetical protein